MKLLNKQQFVVTPLMLKSVLEVSKAVDKQHGSAILGGVCLRIHKESMSVVATDGKVLLDHKYEHGTGLDFGSSEIDLSQNDHMDIIIQASDKPAMAIIKALSSLKEQFVKAEYDGQTLELNGNIIATIEGKYPAYEFSVHFDYRAYTPPQNESYRFCISAKYMALIEKGLSLDKYSYGVIIYPQGPGKGVILKPLHEGHIADRTGLIMPMTIPDHR